MATVIDNPLRGPRLAFAVVAIIGLAMLACVCRAKSADDPQADRERRAKAAIAVARSLPGANAKAALAGPNVAPAPRAVPPKDYATGHREMLIDQMPLVIYVSCDGPKIDGAITCSTKNDTFGTVKGPAVVVGYPQGDRLRVDKVLNCPAKPDDVAKAVKDASRKIDAKGGSDKQMPAAPKPLNLQIAAPAPCVCGDGCKCAAGDCPGKCPLTYEQVSARVAKGERLYLSVGVQATGLQKVCDGKQCRLLDVAAAVDSLTGFTPGVYECFLLNGKPVMQTVGKILAR